MKFYVETAGRWSGGGSAFLNNARGAATRHAILRGEPGRAIPIIARNVPPRSPTPRGDYVLAPQNAWPWNPVASGVRERTRVTALRAASTIGLRRASAVMRISSVIPTARHIPSSPVIHNVLDEGFEEALAASTSRRSPWPGHIVSIGSLHSYRNVPGLIAGYHRYRQAGGQAPLLIAGPAGSPTAVAAARSAARGVPDITFVTNPLPRDLCLAVMREAAAVVLPSRVEASPLTTLEACSVTPCVTVSRIPAHAEILEDYATSGTGDDVFVDPLSPREFAAGIVAAEGGGAGGTWHEELASAAVRSRARERWGDRLAAWLQELPDGMTQKVGP